MIPIVLGTLAYIVGLIMAYTHMSTHYTPEGEYEAWDDVMCDIAWDETIACEHAMLDMVGAHLAQCEADEVDASWVRTIAAMHTTYDVLYCTMRDLNVRPKLRYTQGVGKERAMADGG